MKAFTRTVATRRDRSWSGHAAVSGGVAMLVVDWVHVLSAGVRARVVFAAA